MKTNRFDTILFLLAACLCFGNIGGALQVDRVIAIALLPLFMQSVGKSKDNSINGIIKWVIFFCIFCGLSLAWTTSPSESFKSFVYYPVHSLLFLEVIVFSKRAIKPLTSISKGWLVAAGLSLIVASWELYTGQHLQFVKETSDVINIEGQILKRLYAAVTFTNYNSYVTFLCFALPWMYYSFSQNTKKLKYAIMCFLIIIFAFVVIITNASRGGILTYILMSTIYFFAQKNNKIRMLMVPIVALLFFLLYKYGDNITTFALARSSGGGLVQDSARSSIWTLQLQTVIETLGMGAGVGNFNGAPHNLFIEVLVQFGLFFVLIFVIFLLKMLRKIRKIKDYNIRLASRMALYTLPVYSIIDSLYLLHTHFWVLMATIFIFINYEHSRCPNRIIRKTT